MYVPGDENISAIEQHVQGQMQPKDLLSIELRRLPSDLASVREHGLLYLPRPYVVPGGRFNEMYGWDSFFIQMGLLRDGELGLAQDMADNLLYEVREYGKVLNANRTLYLDSLPASIPHAYGACGLLPDQGPKVVGGRRTINRKILSLLDRRTTSDDGNWIVALL